MHGDKFVEINRTAINLVAMLPADPVAAHAALDVAKRLVNDLFTPPLPLERSAVRD